MKLTIIGTGYVGLISGACFADIGHKVICVDVDQGKIERLRSGEVPIYEPGLEEIIKKNVKAKRLTFSSDVSGAIKSGAAIMICVGTPSRPDGSVDLKYIYQVAKEIGQNIDGHKIIVQKSTVPPGTAKEIENIIRSEIKKRETKINFDIVSNPEFLKEGNAVSDFKKPDRIVVGVESADSEDVMKRLYAPFMRTGYRVIFMDVPSAELAKYAANAMLATRISFMNMIAQVAEKVGADIDNIRAGIGSDSRIGKHFLFAGLGYGGSCFPKDVKGMIDMGKKLGCDVGILEEVEKTNKLQRKRFLKKITNYFGEDLSGLTFAVWGLAFKPETDDLREAPSIDIIKWLLEKGARVRVFDPQAMENFKKEIFDNTNIFYAKDEYEVVKRSDAILVLTEWMQFRDPDWKEVYALMSGCEPAVFDGRNLYDPKTLEESGFKYFCFGK